MGGKKKQRTKWRKLSIGPEEHPGCEGASAPVRDNDRTERVKTSWVAVPLVPLIPAAQCYTENGPDNPNGETKGCYVNGLWIPNSELRRYRSSAPPPPPVGPTVPGDSFVPQHYYLYFILPKGPPPTDGSADAAPPYWSQPEVTQPEEQGCTWLYGTVTYPVVLAPPHPQLLSRSCYYRGRRKPKSFADFGTDNGRRQETTNVSDTMEPCSSVEDLVTRTIASSMDEAKPEIVSVLHRDQLVCFHSLAGRLLESILNDVHAELRKVLRLKDAEGVNGRANKLASQILSGAVLASAKSLLEITRREEGLTSQCGSTMNEERKKNLMTNIRDKAHFLGVTATSPEAVLRGMLGTDDDNSELDAQDTERSKLPSIHRLYTERQSVEREDGDKRLTLKDTKSVVHEDSSVHCCSQDRICELSTEQIEDSGMHSGDSDVSKAEWMHVCWLQKVA